MHFWIKSKVGVDSSILTVLSNAENHKKKIILEVPKVPKYR